MFRLNSISSDQKPSRSGSKGGLRAIASRLKPDLRLAVDTDVSRHQGSEPEQVFPYETRSQSRGNGYHPSISLQRKNTRPTGLRKKLQTSDGTQFGLVRSESARSHGQTSTIGLPSRPDANKAQPSSDELRATGHVLHNRVRGLRPTPLNLDISPSDRAIPIGIAIPSAAISNHTTSPLTATPRTYSPPQHAHDATTPTIVVTPAREDFDITPPSYQFRHEHGQRPASSVYSRYTNCAPRTAEFAATPPVPPLPLFAQQPLKQTAMESKLPSYEESRSATSHKATLSVCTVFEEDEHLQPPMSARSVSGPRMRPLKRQSTLPTPRRSRGWWNLITSPFSARSNAYFWKSPTDESLDRTAILDDAADMGVDEKGHEKLYQSSMAVEYLEPQSAPASRIAAVPGLESRSVPKRSATAPGALDPSDDVVNIYRVPSQGTAASYYDQTRHFPSLLIEPADAIPRSVFEDDSPLTDVCACERHRHGKSSESNVTSENEQDKRLSTCSRNSTSTKAIAGGAAAVAGGAVLADELKSPFDDSHAISDRAVSPVAPRKAMFTSPTPDEMKSPSPTQAVPDQNQESATADSRMSITSATPVIENAHMATMVGPRSSNGEQRAVIIPPSRAPSPPSEAVGLQAATMASRSTNSEPAQEPIHSAPPPDAVRPPMHSREGSRGLGISNGNEDLYPQPKLLSEKPRLGTDRFGQLVIVSEKYKRPRQPWYRRFFWLLVTAGLSLLLLLVVLLVVFVPQLHSDNAVQAQWLNLTGFPPLPTGVSTVIQPKKTHEESKCIDPPSLWSCAVPQTQLASSNSSDLPNFRFEIRFRNNTIENTTALMPATNQSSTSGPASAKSQLRARSAWSQILYTPNPPPPSEEDQLALGKKSTENVSEPYNGEETPFYLSLLNPEPIPTLSKRDSPAQEEEGKPNPYPYPTIQPPSNTTTTTTTTSNPPSTSIPKPLLLPNGKPAPPLLYPYTSAQPLRLYNRGQPDEHYAFYTYFSKSVLLANGTSTTSSISNSSTPNNSTPSLIPVSSASDSAHVFCAFAQTRMRVQIWTQRFVAELKDTASASVGGDSGRVRAYESSANEMEAPGSFPLGVSVSVDRESGPEGNEGKGVFCWALSESGSVVGEGVRIDSVDVGDGVGLEDGEGGDGKCGCGWES